MIIVMAVSMMGLTCFAGVPPSTAFMISVMARDVKAFSFSPFPNKFKAVVGFLAVLMNLLTQDWGMIAAGNWNRYGTTSRSRTSVQSQAIMIVVVSIPGLDPGVAVGTDAIELDIGSISKVKVVQFGQNSSLFTACAIGFEEWDFIFDDKKISALELANIAIDRRTRTAMLNGFGMDEFGNDLRLRFGKGDLLSGNQGSSKGDGKVKDLHDD